MRWTYGVVAAMSALQISAAGAFQVLPIVSDVDRKISRIGANPVLDRMGHWAVGHVIPFMKGPVHEAITLSALDCPAEAGQEMSCVTIDRVQAHRALLYGVRWPDDPPFRLNRASPPRIQGCDVDVTLRSTSQPSCWIGLFKDAGKQAKLTAAVQRPAFGPGDYLLYRSHYGDLQFMHAMAAYDGEMAGQTFNRMKMWGQFLWNIATQQTPVSAFLRDLEITDIGRYFPGDITATNLFATGIVEVRKDLDKVAIGILLHMVQDSFAQAHASRAVETGAYCPGTPYLMPGKIEHFHSYAQQATARHDQGDTQDALHRHTPTVSPNVVDTSRAFLHMWQQQKSWEAAEPLFDCVFRPSNPLAPAEAGPYQDPPQPHARHDLMPAP